MTALVVVDLQNDFLPPNGALAVEHGRQIIPRIIELCNSSQYNLVVATRDYHPRGHCSFASTWGQEPYSAKEFESPVEGQTGKMTQILWPDHCVQGSKGCELEAEFAQAYDKISKKIEVKKGYLVDREYYSAFEDCWGAHKTELDKELKERGIKTLHLVGLAYDFCVLNTAISAAKSGYKTIVFKDCCRSVYPEKDKQTEELYTKADITITNSLA